MSIRISLLSVVASALVAVVGSETAQAGIMYAAAGSTFLTIDAQTGNAVVINPDVGLTINALAWNRSTQTLYGAGISGGTAPVFTLNPATGAVTIINPDGRNIVSLDFDDTTNTLYGAAFFGGLPRGFGTVDLTTGLFQAINSDVGRDIDAIAFGPGGNLYATGPQGGGDAFFTINPATGVTSTPISSDIGPNSLALEFDPAPNALFGSFVGGGGTLSNWRTIDANTGAVSAVISADLGSHPVTALTAVPEPSTVMLALAGGALVLTHGLNRRWRARKA